MKSLIFKFISTLLIIILLSLNSFAKNNKVMNSQKRIVKESQQTIYRLRRMLKKHHKHRKKRKRKHLKRIIVKPFRP